VHARLQKKALLAFLPTPLQPVPRLGAALGAEDLWVKRDDLTDVAGGGNKLRKLEFFVQEARDRGASVLVTFGKLQSNHIRCTAAAAARAGMKCIAFYQDNEPTRRTGNTALAGMLGAELRFLGDVDALAANGAIRDLVREQERAGVRCFVIPEGGGDALGALGFVAAAFELRAQLGEQGRAPAAVVVGAGSGGSMAGLALGLRLWLPTTRLIAISVGPPAAALARRAAQIATGAARLLELDHRFTPADFDVRDEWVGEQGYGSATAGGDQAALTAARLEGLLLDPTYVAKAFAGLTALVQRKELASDGRLVFWHTGGVPGLFAREGWLDGISRRRRDPIHFPSPATVEEQPE
jgi:1-aminocyclopropane-1-carboxylate deaminase/D-cysteine desulfhydrase-like pyridoxal-dependent ACC family enzyme